MNRDGDGTFQVRAAFDEAPLKSLPYTSEADAFAALARADALHRDRARRLGPAERIAVLRRFAALVTERAEPLARQAAREGGKPLADSRVEIARAASGVEAAIAEIPRLTGVEIPMNQNAASAHRFAHTFREPRGVVLGISAFNHPFNLIVHQAVTAVAAGCPVLIKPALTTPLSCISVVEMLAEAGLPEGHCQLLLTEDRVTEKLVADPRVAFLTFIGSARVGWHLRSRLAPGAACALEHGGVAPVIVDETADLDACVPLLAKGGYYHAGQVCVSVQRVYAHRSVVDHLAGRLGAAAAALKVGDPLDPATEVGPLIRPGEVDRVAAWVEEAVAGGATLVTGGRRLSRTTYAPTLLRDPPDDARISREEVFGPVVAIYGCDTLDEAIARANAPDAFFQASIFTRHLDAALDASRRLDAVAVMVNDHTAFRVDWMPFGGHRRSGLGLGGIGHTMRDMTLERLVVFRSPVL